MQTGVLAGYPVVDVKCTLVDGSYHEVDSSEMAFKIAGSMAFKDGCKKGNPVIMEPIMKVVVNVPEEYMGDVMGDLNSRRGQIQGMEARTGAQEITATCRYPRCLDMRQSCVPEHRAAVSIQWSRVILKSCRRVLLKRL